MQRCERVGVEMRTKRATRDGEGEAGSGDGSDGRSVNSIDASFTQTRYRITIPCVITTYNF